jgi:hypothetical protein
MLKHQVDKKTTVSDGLSEATTNFSAPQSKEQIIRHFSFLG